MLLDSWVGHPLLGAWLADRIVNLNGPFPQGTIDANFTVLTGKATASILRPADLKFPSMYYGINDGWGVMLINCTPGMSSAADLWRGYLSQEFARPGWRFANNHFREAGVIANDIIRTFGPGLVNKWIIAGWSQGGAIIPWVRGTGEDTLLYYTNTKYVSFGAPRSAGSIFEGLAGKACRWMMEDDPVPLLPPESVAGSMMAGGGVPGVARRLRQFLHHPGGRVLDGTGTDRAAVVPDKATLPQLVAFAGWLVNLNSNAVAAHHIQTYARALHVFDLQPAAALARHVPLAPQEHIVPVNNREFNQAERRQVQQIFAQGAQQQIPPLAVPETLPFTAYKSRRIWYVAFGGVDVAIGPTKKRALNIKNFGNAFLRRLQRAGMVDPAAIVHQMVPYFEAAVDPASGFRPTMRTTLP